LIVLALAGDSTTTTFMKIPVFTVGRSKSGGRPGRLGERKMGKSPLPVKSQRRDERHQNNKIRLRIPLRKNTQGFELQIYISVE
jgi:hypothetical protein